MSDISCLQSYDSVTDAVSFITTKHKKPKRNRSAYILFSIDAQNKPCFGQDLAELNPNDKFVKLGQLWKGVSQEERQFYEEKAKQEKTQYGSKLRNFCQLFPATTISKPRNRIKRPCNAYGYFLKDVKDSIRSQHPGMRMCEVIKIIAEKWRALEPIKKVMYEDRAKQDQKIYHAEMKKDTTAIRAKKVKLNSGLEATNSKENKQESLMSDETEDLTLEDVISPGEVSVKDEEDAPKDCMLVKAEELYQSCLPMIGFQQHQNQDTEAGKSALLDLYDKVESLRQMILAQIGRFTVAKLETLNNSESTASFDLEDLKNENF